MNDSFTTSQSGKSGGNTPNSSQHQEKNHTYQLMEAPEESAQRPQSLRFANTDVRHRGSGSANNSPNRQATAQFRAMRAMKAIETEQQKATQFKTIRGKPSPKAGVQIQAKAVETPTSPNGLPEPMKSNMEAMGDVNLDNVKVSRNSSKPAEIGALAYARGNQIELGPQQEEHLAHEAWHTVQQKQGRVQPTTQAKGIAVNDNPELETEADKLGSLATTNSIKNYARHSEFIQTKKNYPETVQMVSDPTYLDTQNSNIDCQQDNGDDTYSITLGNIELTNVPRVVISGHNYYELEQHMYYGENGWSATGTRAEQVTVDTKVGIQLISNIENLPQTPPGYVAPPTWTHPQQSWDVANAYQNCKGMCYAVSMARLNQAYSDQGVNDAISLNTASTDYRISGTILHNIPEEYTGYGVGGTLANNDYGTLVDDEGVWDGELQKGAALQYWIHSSFDEAVENNFSGGGHSIIFDRYNFNEDGDITGFNYTDYNGVDGVINYSNGVATTSWGAQVIVVGANLIDL